MNETIQLKKCTKCRRELPATPEFFYRNKRYKDNLKQVNSIYNKYKGYNVLFTGHSLGAALANYLYEEFKKRGIESELVIFNRAAGPFDKYVKKSAKRDPNKIHYTFKDDPISERFLKDNSTKHVVKQSPNKQNKHSIWLYK